MSKKPWNEVEQYLRKAKSYDDLLEEIRLRDEEIERLKTQLDECWKKK